MLFNAAVVLWSSVSRQDLHKGSCRLTANLLVSLLLEIRRTITIKWREANDERSDGEKRSLWAGPLPPALWAIGRSGQLINI